MLFAFFGISLVIPDFSHLVDIYPWKYQQNLHLSIFPIYLVKKLEMQVLRQKIQEQVREKRWFIPKIWMVDLKIILVHIESVVKILSLLIQAV